MHCEQIMNAEECWHNLLKHAGKAEKTSRSRLTIWYRQKKNGITLPYEARLDDGGGILSENLG